MTRQQDEWQVACWTGLALLGIYLLLCGGQTFISDGEIMLLTAARIVDYQTITLPAEAAAFPQVERGTDGLLFSRYGLGQPLAASVLYASGTYIIGAGLLAARDPYSIGRFCALLLPAIATAATAALLVVWAGRLYQSLRVGVLLAFLYGLGTLALPYSRFFFSEPLFTCCLVLAAFAIFCGSPRAMLLAGLALGYALATRLNALFLLPAFVVYALLCGQRQQGMTALGYGLLPGVVLVLLHNWLRFGSLLELGYAGEGFSGNLGAGLWGLLFSPGKSVFLYAPLLLAVPLAVLPFLWRFPPEGVCILLLTSLTLGWSATWWMWWAGWGWGPRFLVPLMPFLVLMLGTLLPWQAGRWLLLALVPLAIVSNSLGILVDFNVYLSDVTRGQLAREAIYLYEPAASPLLAHARLLDWHNLPLVSFQLGRPDIGFPEPAATWIPWGLVGLTSGAFIGLRQALD